MSTNFYWRLDFPHTVTLPTGDQYKMRADHMDPKVHIGLRSGAGRYCWDCRQTFCIDGIAGIHASRSKWHEVCPSCGKPPGEYGACTFTWAQDPKRVRSTCEKYATSQVIADEYDRLFTGAEFLKMLEEDCPIEYKGSIGQWFS